MLGTGMPLSEVTAALCGRWRLDRLGVRLLPMSDDRVETHVVIDDDGDERSVRSATRRPLPGVVGAPARRGAGQQILAVGIEQARPAPGVLEAIGEADVVLLPPSNPVVSIGTILGVPGVRDALRATAAPVVGVSPIIGGAAVRGMADACLRAIGVPTGAAAVAGLYADFLDGWLVAEGDDPGAPGTDYPPGVEVLARPLLMRRRRRGGTDRRRRAGPGCQAHPRDEPPGGPAPSS